MNQIMNRYDWLGLVRQPSTWAGLAVLMSMFGVNVAPEEFVQLGAGIAAGMAIFVQEGR